jgi:WD40 repeat protein/energy-coupling factor transporter ATP-binding protein EcfA2
MLNQPSHNGELESYSSDVVSDTQIGTENPFPGLRSFSIDECHLFFGREGQVDDILLKISQNRFVTVMGYSGSGKSSLMFCGMVPVLYGGFMTNSGPYWNVITARPGASPIQGLVDSIVEFMVKSDRIELADVDIHKAIINSVLRSGPDGLIEISRYLQTEKGENIFFLIDQFEEIFRYREHANNVEAQNEAQLYVNMILTAVQQKKIPAYVALTMRSDFIGECSVFPGLTQLINNSNYLVPQMTREQKKMAVEGPIAVAGARVSQRLVKRLLSDMGNDQDQLPILQHALMRSWDNWIENHEPGEPIDLRHYNAIGKVAQALALHANEAFDELPTRQKEIAEVLFKSITEKNQDNKGTRRPARLGLVAELAEASESEVIEVVEKFRRPGRSFLMPAAHVPLNSDSMIELSHESLMRIWNRLEVWVDDEAESASMYKRLSEAASMYQIGKTGLWRPPDLQLALNWQRKQRPTREWAQRYDEAFERAVVFLDTSRITYEAELKNQEMMQKRTLRRARATAIILGIAFVVAIMFFLFSYTQKLEADEQRIAAFEQKNLAEKQTKIAQESREKAEKETKKANAAREQLDINNKELEKIINQLAIEKKRAEDAVVVAKEKQQEAIAAGEKEKVAKVLAEQKTKEAQTNLNKFDRLYMLAIAQNLATKSYQEDDDSNLAGLTAMQGYMYHRRYEGKKYDTYIYRGLYSALTKLSGDTYNAIKVQGPPRNHIKSLAISTKSKNFYSSGADGRIFQGNYETLANQATDYSNPYPSKVIKLSRDENYLVNGSDSSVVQVYNITGKSKPRVIKGLKGGTNDIEFLPDNSGFIVASTGRTLSFVNHQTGELKVLKDLPYELKAISISPDGKTLAGGSWSGQVVLIDLSDYTIITLVDDNSNRILTVRFSPDGSQLAYGMDKIDDPFNKRGLVKLYNFRTKETRQFTGHKAGVYDVEFSPDGKLLASAGSDKKIQLYVLDNPNDLPIEMDNNNGYVWDIEFASGSDYLISAGSESEIRIWPTDPSLLANKICPKLGRNMTQDEWKKYVGESVEFENTCVSVLIKDY